MDPKLPALFNECIHCGFCLPACPTYDVLGTEMDSPRGRLSLMRALETGRLEASEALIRHLDLCLGCRACESECPSGVPYGAHLMKARARLHESRERPVSLRLTERAILWAVGLPPRLQGMGARLLGGLQRTGILRAAGRSGLIARLSPRLAAAVDLLAEAPLRRALALPAFTAPRARAPHGVPGAGPCDGGPGGVPGPDGDLWVRPSLGPTRPRSGRVRGSKPESGPARILGPVRDDPSRPRNGPAPSTEAASGGDRGNVEFLAGPDRRSGAEPAGRTARVGLLEGCVNRWMFGHVNEAAVRLLAGSGCAVLVPAGQRCCGALHSHSGDLEGARRLARANIVAFEKAAAADAAHGDGCTRGSEPGGTGDAGEVTNAGRIGRTNSAASTAEAAHGDGGTRGGEPGGAGRSGEVTGVRARARTCTLDAIVVTAAGCGSAMKEYGALFKGDPEWEARAAAFAAKVKDTLELLAERETLRPIASSATSASAHQPAHTSARLPVPSPLPVPTPLPAPPEASPAAPEPSSTLLLSPVPPQPSPVAPMVPSLASVHLPPPVPALPSSALPGHSPPALPMALPDLPREVGVAVAYHDACHLAHAQGIRAQPRALLAAVPGLRLVPLADADRCCGSAGIYNLLHPEAARAILRGKIENVVASGAAVVAAANPGCLLQLAAGVREAGLRLRVLHPLEILDAAYREETEESQRV